MRHGPHHGAQRSTTTGTFVATTASKSASVPSTSQGRSALHLAHLGSPVAAAGTRLRALHETHVTMLMPP